ncbi:MAG: molybdopterin-dependent oxidoreductase [Thermomicrobiales bacterium]
MGRGDYRNHRSLESDHRRKDGAQAILPYSYSGTLGLVENLVASSRLWNRMGACGLERTICDAAATAASIATIGGKYGPDPDDVKQTRTLIIWGHNPASTNPHFMPVLREAQKNGTCVVVIDPRRSLTADRPISICKSNQPPTPRWRSE